LDCRPLLFGERNFKKKWEKIGMKMLRTKKENGLHAAKKANYPGGGY